MAAQQQQGATDPVCGMTVDPETAAGTAVYDGRHLLLLQPRPVENDFRPIRAVRTVHQPAHAASTTTRPTTVDEAVGIHLSDAP